MVKELLDICELDLLFFVEIDFGVVLLQVFCSLLEFNDKGLKCVFLVIWLFVILNKVFVLCLLDIC